MKFASNDINRLHDVLNRYKHKVSSVGMVKLIRPLLIVFVIFFLSLPAIGQVSITGGSGGALLCANGGYTSLSPIVITETNNGDFNIRTFVIDTLNLSFSVAGFEFEPNVGSVSFSGTGSASVIATSVVTASKIAIRIVEGDNTNATGI